MAVAGILASGKAWAAGGAAITSAEQRLIVVMPVPATGQYLTREGCGAAIKGRNDDGYYVLQLVEVPG